MQFQSQFSYPFPPLSLNTFFPTTRTSTPLKEKMSGKNEEKKKKIIVRMMKRRRKMMMGREEELNRKKKMKKKKKMMMMMKNDDNIDVDDERGRQGRGRGGESSLG